MNKNLAALQMNHKQQHMEINIKFNVSKIIASLSEIFDMKL